MNYDGNDGEYAMTTVIKMTTVFVEMTVVHPMKSTINIMMMTV